MLTILLYVALVSGGLLCLLLLLSLFAGVDFDMDVDVDMDSGGLGWLKGGLAFLSIGSYVLRSVLMTSNNVLVALVAGVGAGLLTVWILSALFRWLLNNQEEVNYEVKDALFATGTTYLKVPANGQGIVKVPIKGVVREFKAITDDVEDIPTGVAISVVDVDGDTVKVTRDI